ncbi:glutamine--scyllo-inositol transaminase [Fictibacillus macauensis ZFHKF-1]|uniref:Glutamine--scyllo-inositol transaminase n=1 Tax=Fictibacillus macauensis ZFHKF-1 TaxID=1196324 RepID=I8UI95_9BACL|nr:aminotransferase class I/II-fold pyridoxal phosphate-dependent enzyme [Fictibacillus macauensis]EIT86538.1 glutamine--scyllo-inositol transaminase [Fictibacillus macauensis ZFHKF-1]
MNSATKERIFLSPPHMSGKEQQYINEAFESNWIAPLGPNVDAFEQEMASYIGSKGASAVSSGTAAIHLALRLLGVTAGDIVFCSSLTFVASANPILYEGATPVFIDSEPETWNMSPDALQRAFAEAKQQMKLPKAVIIVHLYGQSAKMDELVAICNFYNVPVIEDAAESLGSTYKGKKSGTMGDFGVYSFNGNKIITTSGGGMLVSNNLEALEQAKFLATQARDVAPYYQHSTMGHNYRMSNLLAGVGRAQLAVLEQRVMKRREIFQTYKEAFAEQTLITFMPELPNTSSNRWLTTATLKSEENVIEMIASLESKNIEARRVWKPLHLQPLFASCEFYAHDSSCSVSEQLFKTGICLPSGSSLSECEQSYVIASMEEVFLQNVVVK